MTTDTAPIETDPGANWIHEDMRYIKTAVWLGFFTGVEVFTYFESVHHMPKTLLVVLLSVLMVVKFTLVAAIFMHLADDHAVFTKMLVMGLCIAWPVYVVAGYALEWLPDWNVFVKVAFLAVPPIVTGWLLGISWKGGEGHVH